MYKVDYDFSKVSNEIEAYILGFIYADGYILDSPHNRLGIMLSVKDKKLLERIGNYISKDIPIRHQYGEFETVRFILCRKEVVQNLKRLGISQGKSAIDFNIPIIEDSLYPHFIRGYFDGDGSVLKDRKYIKFYICSPLPKILEDFKNILEKHEIHSYLRIEYRKGKIIKISKNPTNYDQYRLIVDKNVYLQKLYNYLYKDATIFLERKKNLMEKCFYNNERTSNDLNFISYNGKVKSLQEWSIELQIPEKILHRRLFNSKWNINDAFKYKEGEVTAKQKQAVQRGANHPNSKFSEEEVIEIFLSKESNSFLTKKYNVHRDTIRKIKYGINFSSITNKLIKN